jgi:hypothetical protein
MIGIAVAAKIAVMPTMPKKPDTEANAMAVASAASVTMRGCGASAARAAVTGDAIGNVTGGVTLCWRRAGVVLVALRRRAM